jgi:hypothetical protein
MIANLKALWLNFYAKHIQKTAGAILGVAMSGELLSYYTQWNTDLTLLLGLRPYTVIKILLGLLIVYRAAQVSNRGPLPPPDPSATR